MNYDKRFQSNVHVFLPVQKKTAQTLKPLAVHAHYTLRMIHPVHTRYYFTITGRPALSHKTRAKKPQQSNNNHDERFLGVFLRGIFPANSMICLLQLDILLLIPPKDNIQNTLKYLQT